MSSYSLNILNSEKYSREVEEVIIYSFDDYIYKEHFRVGQGIKDVSELKHSLIMKRILCSDNCDIINYIQDKIEGKLENCVKNKKKKITNTLFNFCQQESCGIDEIDTKNYWSIASW
jgi:hypothetical protein